ncbi:MAG: hypothetical protein AseanaTS_20510 [Candidatus Pelagadaptatus aseana]
MPVMDGIETAKQIQTNSNLVSPPQIILVTAYGREAAMEIADEIQIKDFLSKPVTPSTLLDSILLSQGKKEFAPNPVGNMETEEERAIDKLRGAKILLAEDNEINMELAVDILERQDITVVTAVDGQQALERLEQEEVDGVLMDCQMPVMDGYEATQAIRSDSKFKKLPILAMTANAMVGDKEKVLAAGMNDHIAKPIRKRDLFITMARWIKPKSPLSQSSREALPDVGKMPEIEGVDIEIGMQTFEGNAALYKKLLLKFADREVDFRDRFLQSLAQQDDRAAVRCAHTLKGVAANIAAHDIQQSAASLELSCAQPDNQESMMQLLDAVQANIDRVVKAIHQADWGASGESVQSEPLSSLPDLLKQLLQQVENCDAESLTILDAIRQHDLPKDRESIRQIHDAINEFDFDRAEQVIRQWLGSL